MESANPLLSSSGREEDTAHSLSLSQSPTPNDTANPNDNASPNVNPNDIATAGPDEIENKRITSLEDQVNSADASASGGSDTEASRADSSKLRDGTSSEKSHARTSSLAKKPATFKAVSVNKTFLASKAPAPSTTTKVSDKAKTGSSTPPPSSSSATLSASRPRLVAKSGSGARESPRLSGANGGKPASAPDPNAVWNKNRPTPAPDPKKMTDEDLKKYGIHVASRLEEDDTQGQSKWADLDDDDEDWAPEAITWTDGTKTTLPHTDEVPAPNANHEPPPPAPPAEEEQSRAKSSAMPPASAAPPPKPAGLPSGRGLVLKNSVPEKPTLVARPPAPQQPAKSPWATLPPVEKASPAAPEPASVMSRGPAREPLPHKGMGSAMPPQPREIAADDFNRSSWRDGNTHNRELFNSQSGRYEPAPDRRGSLKSDQVKHPSVLQRPPYQSDHPEPSSAFQTHRTSQEGHFGRRRGSSNVSGGSGTFFQRLGKGSDGHMPPPEFAGARRASHAGSVESPVSPAAVPVAGPGPVPAANQGRYQQPPPSGYPPRASPNATFASPQASHAVPNAAPQQPTGPSMDDIEYQKKLMRERTELARKRRQEEEAAEEAARRERIQKKLDAMGPSPVKEQTSPNQQHAQQDQQAQPAQKTLASKWANSVVADNDKKMNADRLAERVERERQLAERGMTLKDAQPAIKDTWRQVNVGEDGTRRPLAPWQPPRDDASKTAANKDSPASLAHPGVIGSAGSYTLSQPAQTVSSFQRKTSRFFPARDTRTENAAPRPSSRTPSPTPPPPTMEDHPAYEGNMVRPHVSLPKPQPPRPVVKLPPAMAAAAAAAAAAAPQQQPPVGTQRQFAWATPTPYTEAGRGSHQQQAGRRAASAAAAPGSGGSQEEWQKRFNNLLSNSKQSPPKAMGIDPSSKNALDYHIPEDLATVSLPGRTRTTQEDVAQTATSKSMAEECFDEPEIGSLPLVKLPHRFPEGTWPPAEVPAKSLPKRFAVQPSAMEPFYFAAEVVSGGNALHIHFPGMSSSKVVTIPFTTTRGGRGDKSKSRGGRGGNRSNSNKGEHSSREGSGSSHTPRGGRGRGGFRSRGSDNWTRNTPAQSSLQA